MIAECVCQSCGNPLEFEAENSGVTVECPHCSQQTLLQLPKKKTVDVQWKAPPSVLKASSATMRPSVSADETTFFQNGNIVVTNARFIVGAQTFAMRGITSVEGIETPPNLNAPLALMFIGFLMALFLLGGAIVIGILGLLILAGGIMLALRSKPTFAVVLRTAGGEVTAYRSFSNTHIAEIIHALNEAIISHG